MLCVPCVLRAVTAALLAAPEFDGDNYPTLGIHLLRGKWSPRGEARVGASSDALEADAHDAFARRVREALVHGAAGRAPLRITRGCPLAAGVLRPQGGGGGGAAGSAGGPAPRGLGPGPESAPAAVISIDD